VPEPELLTGEAFRQLFLDFSHTAIRLETRDRYASPIEDEQVGRFLAGEPLDLSWLDRWFGMVRTATESGRRFARVRVVSEPLSDYKRFEMVVCPLTVAAGEDIRYLPRAHAAAFGVPNEDFWLFDDERLARLHFSEQDAFLGAEIVTEPEVVRLHRRWLAIATAHGIPFTDYLRQRPEAAGRGAQP
jgi:hypothetical protein